MWPHCKEQDQSQADTPFLKWTLNKKFSILFYSVGSGQRNEKMKRWWVWKLRLIPVTEEVEHNEVLNKEDLSRDWFSERAGGWEGLKCWSGSKTIMRLGGFIVFWKWKWDLNIFTVNRKHTLCFTCLPAAQIETIFPIRRPK